MAFALLKRFFQNEPSNASPSKNDTFIRLVQLIDRDEGFRESILRIINLDPFQRASFINTMVDELSLKKSAPKEHIQALKILTQDQVCQQIKALIRDNQD